MKKYSHLFFDLDHTLWDYERNSEATLEVLYDKYELDKKSNFTINEFILKFKLVNDQLWNLYHSGQIDQGHIRKERFKSIFSSLSFEFDATNDLSTEYIAECPKMGNTIPGAIELLEHFIGNYQLNIITNGFAEIQHAKLSASGLDKYFDEIIISSHTNFRKPDREIFLHALEKARAHSKSSIMIGDNLESDIRGAKNVPMDQVFFNPKEIRHDEEVTYEITSLLELKAMGF